MKIIALAAIALWLGCTPNRSARDSDYLKSPSDFRIRPLEGDTSVPSKFILSWQNPQQVEDFQGVTLFLDTAKWTSVVKNHSLANGPTLFLPFGSGERDSILVSLKASGGLDSAGSYFNIPYFIMDSTNHQDSGKFEFTFALVSKYGSPGGQPRFTTLIVDDRFKPSPVQPEVKFTDRSIELNWLRPRDPTSFFDLGADSGIIKGYHLLLTDSKIQDDIGFLPLQIDSIRYQIGNSSWKYTPAQSNLPIPSSVNFDRTSIETRMISFFADGARVHAETDSNRIGLKLYGFIPRQKYRLQIYAEDSLGNVGKNDAELITVVLTDTTKPTQPKMTLDSARLRSNQFVLGWNPSRDTRPGDTEINQNIKGYFLWRIAESKSTTSVIKDTTRIFLGAQSKGKLALKSEAVSILTPEPTNQKYEATFVFLPPSTQYTILLWAVDSSEYKSDVDTLVLTTPSVDSTIQCPAGFTVVPHPIEPFCMELREHHDSAGKFSMALDFFQAQKTCRALTAQLSTQVELCRETQWETACKGGNAGYPLKYGILSLSEDPTLRDFTPPNSILQSHCNQATNDEEMAVNIQLRNPQCVNDFGIFDFAGNFSEWVVSDSGGLLFKGGNYLRPNLDIVQTHILAECSYKGFPRQKRPVFPSACVSGTRGLALRYLTAAKLETIDCPNLGKEASSFRILQKDSSEIEVRFTDGSTQNVTIVFPADTARNRPPSINLYDSLVVTLFVPDSIYQSGVDFKGNPEVVEDTLSLSEILQSGLIFPIDGLPTTHPAVTREANKANWKILPIEKIYAFVPPPPGPSPHSKPAKNYFGNTVLGFRCCSKPL